MDPLTMLSNQSYKPDNNVKSFDYKNNNIITMNNNLITDRKKFNVITYRREIQSTVGNGKLKIQSATTTIRPAYDQIPRPILFGE